MDKNCTMPGPGRRAGGPGPGAQGREPRGPVPRAKAGRANGPGQGAQGPGARARAQGRGPRGLGPGQGRGPRARGPGAQRPRQGAQGPRGPSRGPRGPGLRIHKRGGSKIIAPEAFSASLAVAFTIPKVATCSR